MIVMIKLTCLSIRVVHPQLKENTATTQDNGIQLLAVPVVPQYLPFGVIRPEDKPAIVIQTKGVQNLVADDYRLFWVLKKIYIYIYIHIKKC